MPGERSAATRGEDARPQGIADGNKSSPTMLHKLRYVHAGTIHLDQKKTITRIARQRALNSAENQKNKHDEKH
jgi:hypothetical protein